MTLQSDITTIQDTIDDIETAIVSKGVTPSGGLATFASAINNIGATIGLTREVSSSGVYQQPTQNFTFTLPENATDLGDYALYWAFTDNAYLTSVNMSSLITISGNQALFYAFRNCTALTSIDLSSLETVSANNTFNSNNFTGEVFTGCNSLATVDLSSLTTVSGNGSFSSAFSNKPLLTSIDLSSLETISGSSAMSSMFYNSTNFTSIDLSSLETISGSSALKTAFRNTALTTLSFPSLNSNSFGSYTNQFNNMLQGVTGCTVHFPSNLQSVIGSWTDIASGFGGTNTTVLFDLPATT